MRLLPRRLPTVVFVIGASLGCLLTRCLSPLLCAGNAALHQGSIRSHASVHRSGARLMAAVLLPQRLLNTTGQAIMETWGSEMAGFRIFVGGDDPSPETFKRLPVMALKGVPDFESYVSLHQTFAALTYLHDYYSEQYDWFLLADNRTYVSARELETLLHAAEPRSTVYWGKPEELLEGASERLCAGSFGVILSGLALKAVVPHLKDCAEQAAAVRSSGGGGVDRAERGDWALGLCFSRVVGISCSMPSEYFHYDTQGDLQSTAFLSTNSPQLNMEGTLAFLAKTTESHYVLHYLVKKQQLNVIREEVASLELELTGLHTRVTSTQLTLTSEAPAMRIEESTMLANEQPHPSTTSPLLQDQSQHPLSEGSSSQIQPDVAAMAILPQTKFDVNTWTIIVGPYIYSDQRTDPLLRVPNSINYEVQQFVSKAVDIINTEEKAGYTVKEVNNVFLRYSPVFGRQCIMDLMLHDQSSGRVSRKRMNLAYPLQSVPVHITEQPDYKLVVHVIVPLSNVGERFSAFFNDFQRDFLRRRVGVRLVLVVYGEDDFKRITSVVTSTRQWPPSRLIIVQGEGEFTRGRALHLGLSQLGNSDLAFFCDTDMVMTREFMDRCRLNPVQGKRVYYPIFFSYYNTDYAYHGEPKPDRLVVSRRNGHWVSYSYGMVCMYKSDYVATGGFNLTITGWGGEDTDFFTKVLDTKLEVLKSPDPGLTHRWHPKHCSPSLTPSQYNDCLGTRDEVLADKKQLASYITYLEEHLGIKPATIAAMATNVSAQHPTLIT